MPQDRQSRGKTIARARILVSGGEPHPLRATSRLLKKAGYEVLDASTGQEALHLAREHRPDLVLLDLTRPDGDGLEVGRHIKGDAELEGTFVVLLSERETGPDDQVEGVEGGADDCILRPVSNRELLARVEAMLRLKQAQDALRDSEARYRRLVEGSPDIAYIFSDKQGALYWSSRVETVLGYPPDLLLEKPFTWHDSIHPDDLPAVDKAIAESQAGAGFDIEYRIRDVRGNWLWLHDRFISKRQAGDEIIIEGLATDITDRKRVEGALWARTHELGERVKELNCLYDIADLVETPGISLDEILQGTADLIPSAWQYPEIACARITLDGQEFKSANFQETAWGQVSDLVVHGKPSARVQVCYLENRPQSDEGPFLKEERHLLDAVAGRLGKVIERMRGQDALRESEKRFKALYEGIPVPVYAWQRSDKDFVLVDHNDAARAVTADRITDFLGTTAAAMYAERPDIVKDISRCFAEQTSIQREMAYQFITTGERRVLMVNYAFVPPDLVLVHTEDITRRKQAEEALRESESRLELAVAGSNGGVWQIALDPDDPSHALPDEIFFSPRLKSLIGYEEDEFPDSMAAWESRVLPEDLARLRESSQKYRDGQADRHELEYRIRHKDGSIRWLRTCGQVERDQDGRPVRFAGIDWDITEPKLAQQALRRERDLVARVMGTSPVGITVFDRQGRITFANALVQEMAALTAEPTPVGHTYNDPLWKVVTEDGRPFPDEQLPFARVMNTGQPAYNVRHAIELPDGQRLYISSNAAPLFDEAGQIDSVVVTTEDITARIQVDKELRLSEEKYRDLVEQISDVIYAIDTEGAITYVSPAIESFIGSSPEQVIGRPFAQFIASEDLERIGDNFQQLMSGLSPGPGEYRALTASGEIRWMRISSQPIVDGDRVTGARGVLTDITARKRAEEHLEEMAAAAERERLARELHDAVTQSLFAASLIAETLPHMWERHPETGRRALEELREMTQGALAELRTMLLELRPGALAGKELGALLRQLTDGMMARTRTPVVTTIVGDCSLPTEVKLALYRIAQEALNNVAKHAQASQAKVYLHCEPGHVTLEIGDDGCGFAPHDTESHHLGVGIMRERAQAIGAELVLESELDRGTEIRVTWEDADWDERTKTGPE